MTPQESVLSEMLTVLEIAPIPDTLYARVCEHFDCAARGCTPDQVAAYMRHCLTNYDQVRKQFNPISQDDYLTFKGIVNERLASAYARWQRREKPILLKEHKPMRTKYIRVAGVTFAAPDGTDRQAVLAKLRGGEAVQIRPEADNPHDRNALAVLVAMPDGTTPHIGYIPKGLAAELAPLLDGESVICEVDSIVGGFDMRDGEVANLGMTIKLSLPDITPDDDTDDPLTHSERYSGRFDS